MLQGGSAGSYSDSESDSETFVAATQSRTPTIPETLSWSQTVSGQSSDTVYQSGLETSGTYGNSSYSFGDSGGDTLTDHWTDWQGTNTSDTWTDGNAVTESAKGGGSETETGNTTYSWHDAATSGNASYTANLSPSFTTPGAAVDPSVPDATSVPVSGSDQSSGMPSSAVAYSCVPEASDWEDEQGEDAEEQADPAEESASTDAPKEGMITKPAATPSGPLPSGQIGKLIQESTPSTGRTPQIGYLIRDNSDSSGGPVPKYLLPVDDPSSQLPPLPALDFGDDLQLTKEQQDGLQKLYDELQKKIDAQNPELNKVLQPPKDKTPDTSWLTGEDPEGDRLFWRAMRAIRRNQTGNDNRMGLEAPVDPQDAWNEYQDYRRQSLYQKNLQTEQTPQAAEAREIIKTLDAILPWVPLPGVQSGLAAHGGKLWHGGDTPEQTAALKTEYQLAGRYDPLLNPNTSREKEDEYRRQSLARAMPTLVVEGATQIGGMALGGPLGRMFGKIAEKTGLKRLTSKVAGWFGRTPENPATARVIEINPRADTLRPVHSVGDTPASVARAQRTVPFDQALSDAAQPIQIVEYNGNQYVVSGHHRIYGLRNLHPPGTPAPSTVRVQVFTPEEYVRYAGADSTFRNNMSNLMAVLRNSEAAGATFPISGGP